VAANQLHRVLPVSIPGVANGGTGRVRRVLRTVDFLYGLQIGP
jgi:hypothetical protein